MSLLQLGRDWASGGLNTDYKGINIWKVCLDLGASLGPWGRSFPFWAFSTLTTLNKDLPASQNLFGCHIRLCQTWFFRLSVFVAFLLSSYQAPLQRVAHLQIIRSRPIVHRAPWQPLTSSHWATCNSLLLSGWRCVRCLCGVFISILKIAPKLNQLN